MKKYTQQTLYSIQETETTFANVFTLVIKGNRNLRCLKFFFTRKRQIRKGANVSMINST